MRPRPARAASSPEAIRAGGAPAPRAMSVFALLDDATAPPGEPRSRLCRGWIGECRCDDPAGLDAAWARARQALGDEAAVAVVLADYEWGVRLAGVHPGVGAARPGALRLLLFREVLHLDAEGVAAWLAEQAGSAGPAAVLGLGPDDDDASHARAIDAIHARIRAGETYQVNHTRRWRGRAAGSPLALYRRLRAVQPVPFGALIALPEGGWVLSCSPELFLAHRAGRLHTRPMKGTAPRHADPAADRAAAAWLASDPKNRAENLMIVDLLRNDLGRIARTGGVRVPSLFAIEPYRTVYQMTSTVEADLPPGTDLPDVLRALFPCGSITGAPKHRTMQIIGALEGSPRGLYTGAIGWIEPPRAPAAMGDFTLSVAIRTLELGPPSAPDGTRPLQVGVGSGIVLDSRAADESRECRDKLRFLARLDPGFTLFETMRVEPGPGGPAARIARLPGHLARLRRSAAELGFAHDEAAVLARLDEALAQAAPAHGPQRLRLDLAHDGTLAVRLAPLGDAPREPVRLLAPVAAVLEGERALLGHKTSWRTTYDAAMGEAVAAGAFDRLFVNAAGELTEGARSTLLVRLDGAWWTPPRAAGVLPGVMRQALRDDPAWALRERVLRPEDLRRAEAVAVCNALWGVLRAIPPVPGSG